MGQKGKNRKAVVAEAVGREKRVAVEPGDGYYDHYPRWRFSRMEFCEPYGWQNLTGAELQEIQERLADLETITWREIILHRTRLHHYCPTRSFSDDARKRLRALNLDDLERMMRLRITSKKRLWGIIDDNDGTFNILWWDPEHAVSPYTPRNT